VFTGDRSGEWLFRALHRAGFANKPESLHRDDDLRLIDCAITAVCHCAPPDNKPTRDEIAACRTFLSDSFDAIPARVFLALGQIAWQSIVDEARQRGWYSGARPKFGHGAVCELAGGRCLVGSYHPSQQNTFTGKLTEPMFDAVFEKARRLLNGIT
jgi:uracil-DNA glycosylase family 4